MKRWNPFRRPTPSSNQWHLCFIVNWSELDRYYPAFIKKSMMQPLLKILDETIKETVLTLGILKSAVLSLHEYVSADRRRSVARPCTCISFEAIHVNAIQSRR